MRCKFHIGQKVVTLDRNQWPNSDSRNKCEDGIGPQPREIVTIRAIVDYDGEIGLLLAEYIRSKKHGYEPAFYYDCFAPIVEKEIDISIFTKMLTPTKESVS